MKKLLYGMLIIGFIGTYVPFLSSSVQAGTKDLDAGKRSKFKDDNVDSLRDVFIKRDEESEQYRKKMLENSDKTIALLEDVKKLLIQLNQKN